jgi:hypothetical protein
MSGLVIETERGRLGVCIGGAEKEGLTKVSQGQGKRCKTLIKRNAFRAWLFG